MSASASLDAMHLFLERTAEIRGVGDADFGVTAVVDGTGRLIELSISGSLRGVRADRLAEAVELAAARAVESVETQRAELLALLHSSLSAP